MTIEEMHYDFKKKLNKVDSQQYNNLLIPEIDWVLNEAQNVFIDIIAEPRIRTYLGFEKSQKNIDDIRTLVVNDQCSTSLSQTGDNFYYTLPLNYRYYVNSKCYISKGNCSHVKSKIFVRQHDDEFEDSPFDKSSFEWRTVNLLFVGTNEVKLHTDGTFVIDEFCLSYIKNPVYIHNAANFRTTGTYNLPSGTVLTGTQDCELPEHTHREIVDIAVMITTGEIESPAYQLKLGKLGLNYLK